MDLRSGNSASRRRRVLREDVATVDGEVAAPRRKTRVRIDAAHYPEAAHPHRQPRLADLLPTKWWSVTLTVGAGVVVATALLTGFAYRSSLAALIGETAIRPLDLTVRGNLADWFASWTLLTAALVAGIVYSLRRHRTDDYRGRYRAWLWTAFALVLGAMDAASGFHQSLSGAVVALTGITVCGKGAFWWLLVEGLTLVAVSAAMAREYVRCRLSLATLSLALLAYAGLATATVYRLDVSGSTNAWLVQESFRLFGHLLLALSTLLYARHVLREVQGLSKTVRRKRKTKADAAGEEEESRVPAPHFRAKAEAPKSEVSKAKPSVSSASATSAVAKAPTPPAAPPKPEPPRQQSAPVTAKPADGRSSDMKSSSSSSGEVRRTDPPSRNAGPLAGKLRPSSAPVTSSVASSSSSSDDEDDDDDRNSRKNKKRGR